MHIRSSSPRGCRPSPWPTLKQGQPEAGLLSAKTQAVLEAGFRATGTASDAICIAAPAAGQPEDFTGPRSLWGARIARAVHSAVHAGAVRYAAKASPG